METLGGRPWFLTSIPMFRCEMPRTQRMTEEDAEEDDEMILCGPKQQVRLNLWDLTIEVEETLCVPTGREGKVSK